MAGIAFQGGVQLAMIFAIVVRGAETLSVTGPKNAIRQKGQLMTFTCSFDNNCEHGGWSFKGTKIYRGCNSTILLPQFGSRTSLEFDGASSVCGKYNLQVNGLKLEDSGLFGCEGTLSDGTSFKKRAELLVIEYLPKCSMSVGEPTRSQSLTITCSISYTGTAPVELVLESVKDGKRVLNSTKGSKSIVYKLTAGPVYVPVYKCLLKVDLSSNADPENAGNTPQELDICRSDQVNVTFPVENMQLLPQDTNYRPGTPIQCTAEGFPLPVIEWKKYPGGNVIKSGPRGNILVVDETSKIHTFQCHAMNKVGGTNYTLISYPIKVADNSSVPNAGHVSYTASVVMNVILSLLLAGVTTLIVFYLRIQQETKSDSVKPIPNTYASDTKPSQTTELKTIPPPSPEADPDVGLTYANVPRQSKQVDDELQYEDVPRKSNGIHTGASYSALTAETAIIDQHGYCELRKEPTKDAKPVKKCKPTPLTPKPGSGQKNKNTSK